MQQINLYQDSIRTRREYLGAGQVLVAASVLLAVLLLISGGQWWWIKRSGVALSALRQQQQQLNQSIDKLSNTLAASSNDHALKAEISEKEAELKARHDIMQALSGKQFGNTRGFAAQFTGLAKQHVQGVWLTALYIHAGGTKLDLQGKTYAPELVPQYLQRLAKESSFKGIEFQTFLMQREKKSAQVEFDLRSTEKDKP